MVSGYGQKFKMAEASDNYSCSSEDDEYSDSLEEAASAGARLSVPEKASISRKRKVPTNPAEKKRNVRGSVDPKVSAWDRMNELKQKKTKYIGGLHMPLLSQIGLLQSKRSCWCSLVQHRLNECLACYKMHLVSSKRQH